MIGLLLSFWKPIAGILAILALMGFVAYEKHHYDEARRDEGRAEVQAKWDTDRAERIKRTTEIVVELSGKLMEAKDAQQKRERDIDAIFAVVGTDAGHVVNSGSGIRLPADVRRVLDESADAANSQRSPVVASGEARTDPVPETPAAASGAYDERDLATFFVESAHAYADAYGLWKSCRVREDACRVAVEKGANP
jgi:hypothetical protein